MENENLFEATTENESKSLYEGIDENVVKFTKAIEFYDDYGEHEICKENQSDCKACKLYQLCSHRGALNVNLALHLIDAGYGKIK